MIVDNKTNLDFEEITIKDDYVFLWHKDECIARYKIDANNSEYGACYVS